MHPNTTFAYALKVILSLAVRFLQNECKKIDGFLKSSTGIIIDNLVRVLYAFVEVYYNIFATTSKVSRNGYMKNKLATAFIQS